MLFIASLPACSPRDQRLWRAQTHEQSLEYALTAESADVRRDAVCRIAESPRFTEEAAFAVLDTVARTDPSSQVRCIALCALGRYPDNRPVSTILAVLSAKEDQTPREALPGDEHVRWEAARSLLSLQRRGLLDASQQNAALTTFLQLIDDPGRPVRLVAIEALGEYRDERVLNPLVRMLRVEDFAIADRAERSLIQLTGTTHDYDPQAWERWLAATPDPFARAGQQPLTTRPTGPTWWDTQLRAWRRGLKLGQQD